MKLRNIVLIGAALAMLAAAGALWWIYASRDALVKQAIERYGPEIIKVSVSVKRVRLEPAEGKAAIQGLELGNPAGYQTPHAFTLGEMRLAVDYSTVTSDVIRVKEILIDAPVITYERGPGGDNLAVIQKNIGGGGSSAKKSGEPEKKFIIDDLRITNAKVRFSDTLSLPMPEVHLRDIGKKSNGATADEIAKMVWDSIVGGASNLASRAGSLVKEGAGSVVEGAKGAVEGVRGLFK